MRERFSLVRRRMASRLMLSLAVFLAASFAVPENTGAREPLTVIEKTDQLVPAFCDSEERDFRDCIAQSREPPAPNSGLSTWALVIVAGGIIFGFLIGRATAYGVPDKSAVKAEIDGAFDLRRNEAKVHTIPAYPILKHVLDEAEKEVQTRLKKLKLYP